MCLRLETESLTRTFSYLYVSPPKSPSSISALFSPHLSCVYFFPPPEGPTASFFVFFFAAAVLMIGASWVLSKLTPGSLDDPDGGCIQMPCGSVTVKLLFKHPQHESAGEAGATAESHGKFYQRAD